MADDRMKNDDFGNRNMGQSGGEGQEYGQQTPGRNPQHDRSTGAGQPGQKRDSLNKDDDDEFAGGNFGKSGEQGRGGQNR